MELKGILKGGDRRLVKEYADPRVNLVSHLWKRGWGAGTDLPRSVAGKDSLVPGSPSQWPSESCKFGPAPLPPHHRSLYPPSRSVDPNFTVRTWKKKKGKRFAGP